MRARLFLLSLLALITAFLAGFGFTTHDDMKECSEEIRISSTIRCTPDWNEMQDWLEEVEIPVIPGAGFYKWKITTSNDSAQFYFNQGINMYYSFHIIEAMASFKKAARFDPASPMVYWAQALAYGPNINDVGYAASPEALNAVNEAMERINKASEKEKMLIRAQQVRYSPDSTESRKKLNQLYVDKMRLAYQKYPDDADVAALYADALMLQHPWDLWKNDGTPKPWTPLIRQVLEKLLARTPNHPGANHYYIHVMEPSPFADKALPSADRLGKLTPGLSHTVHMPSHIYLRTGHYEKGVKVNEAALNSYKQTIPLFEPVTGNAFLYAIHNLHMQTNNALMTGRSAYSQQVARETVNSIPQDYLAIPGAMGNYIQNIYMTPLITDVRFGNWNQILTYPEPSNKLIYARLLYHFGRGMSHAATKRLAEARHELGLMNELMKDSVLYLPFDPFSPSIDAAFVAANILNGSIALTEKRYDEAVKYFTAASLKEEKMVYNEPRDWMLNTGHYLGNALNKAGKPAEAIKTFEKDLKNNRENGWSLFGIWQALSIQKKTAEANKILARYKKAFEKADVKLKGAVYD